MLVSRASAELTGTRRKPVVLLVMCGSFMFGADLCR